MSKLYDKYELLKKENPEIIYLFECGNFYIFLDSDAIVINEILNLKLTKFSNLCDKCGFPKSSLDKYQKIFDEKKIKYKIIEQENESSEIKISKIKELLINYESKKIKQKIFLEELKKILEIKI